MDTYAAVCGRRTIRKFTDRPIPRELIDRILNAARLSPSGINRQALRFYAVVSKPLLDKIFPHTRYGGYLPDGSCSPTPAEAPTAIVLILCDRSIAPSDDVAAGAAAQSMMLTAYSEGVGSCWMGAIDREEILRICSLENENLTLHTLISLGYPAMESRAVPIEQSGDVKYYFGKDGVLHVPKRSLEDVTKIL